MTDIVERLRALADCDARAGEPLGQCMREAADEIERLRRELPEVTPEMIEAGVSAFWELPELLGPSSKELEAVVAASFKAMLKVRLADVR